MRNLHFIRTGFLKHVTFTFTTMWRNIEGGGGAGFGPLATDDHHPVLGLGT